MSRSIRLMTLAIAAASWMLSGGLASQVWADEPPSPNKARIDAAVTAAQRVLLSRLSSEPEGTAALATVALLKSGLDLKTKEIQAVCDRIVARVSSTTYTPGGNHIYEAAVSLLALANADAKKYRPQIDTIARYIIANQASAGHWHYPSSPEGDTSISQYAMLALWEAQRHGITIPLEVWERAAGWHIQMQQKDGGFAYHPSAGGGQGATSLHSMTAAGIGSLRISRRYLFPGARERVVIDVVQPQAPKKNRSGKRFGILEPVFRDEGGAEDLQNQTIEMKNARFTPSVKLAQIDESVEKAVAWMTRNFTVDKPTGYPIYFLYSLERSSALLETKAYGTHDWYEEGAAHLVLTQRGGTWTDTSGETPGASFGVLFLVRATAKMVEPNVPRVEFGTGTLVGGRGLPEDLKSAELNDGKVKKEKKSSLEELLTQLENPQIPLLESTQTEIIEQVVIGDRNKLIGQVERLKKLAKHPDAEVRRTALWALGRSDDLRLAPILIAALKDSDVDVFVEARNALRCLSRRVEDFSVKEAPLDAASREKEWRKWQEWYKLVRAYDERDDLVPPGE